MSFINTDLNSSSMTFRENSFANLVFLSVMDTFRNKTQIAREWQLQVSGGPLYQKETVDEINKLVEVGIIEQRGDTLYARIDSDGFKNELLRYIRESDKEASTDASKAINSCLIKNIDEFVAFLSDEAVRKSILSIDIVKEVYKKDIEEAKINPFKIFNDLISIFAVAYLRVYIDDFLKSQTGVTEKNIPQLFKSIFDAAIDKVVRDNPNLSPLLKAIEEQYK